MKDLNEMSYSEKKNKANDEDKDRLSLDRMTTTTITTKGVMLNTSWMGMARVSECFVVGKGERGNLILKCNVKNSHTASASRFATVFSFGLTFIIGESRRGQWLLKGMWKAKKHPELKITKTLSFEERQKEFELISLVKRRIWVNYSSRTWWEGKASIFLPVTEDISQNKWAQATAMEMWLVLGRIRAWVAGLQNARRTSWELLLCLCPRGSLAREWLSWREQQPFSRPTLMTITLILSTTTTSLPWPPLTITVDLTKYKGQRFLEEQKPPSHSKYLFFSELCFFIFTSWSLALSGSFT